MSIATTSLTIRFSGHALSRFRERVRPGLAPAAAQRELEAVAAHGLITARGPTWLSAEPRRRDDLYLAVADAVFPLLAETGTELLATTCLVKGSLSPHARHRRTLARQADHQPQRARSPRHAAVEERAA